MKIGPVFHELNGQDWCEAIIVHTGQHYDANMSDSFFHDLQLPQPHVYLGVGSGSHAEQTAAIMVAYEKVCVGARPDWIIVVGDVNSTLACAIVGKKLDIQVVHLEAGLRSGDRRMPEEINRLATDAISDVLWTPSPDADDNLLREGVLPERIERIGNVMIDSYELLSPTIQNLNIANKLELKPFEYGLVTLHRPSNVDDKNCLEQIVQGIRRISSILPVVFSIHPRTFGRLKEHGLLTAIHDIEALHTLDPVGYCEFMSLVLTAAYVLTDSGGIQEETSYLGVPCLTLRENTERPITVSEGTNRLIAKSEMVAAVKETVAKGVRRQPADIQYWDGNAAARAVADLKKRSC